MPQQTESDDFENTEEDDEADAVHEGRINMATPQPQVHDELQGAQSMQFAPSNLGGQPF